MRSWFKWFVILGVLVGLGVAASISAKSWWHQHSVPKYLTSPITRGRVETVVNSTGTVKPVLSVAVGAVVSGPILKVEVNFNSKVQKGDVLALIDPMLFQAIVDQNKAALKTQQADRARIQALLDQAKHNYERALRLQAIKKDYISEADMDQYKYTFESCKAQRELADATVEQAEATLKNSRTNLEYTRIISPVDGIVIERKVDPGQSLAAAFQTPEMFILAPNMDEYMNVFASVDEADVGLIRAAQEGAYVVKLSPAARAAATLSYLGSPVGEGPLLVLPAHVPSRIVKFTVDAHPGHIFEGTIDQIRLNSTTTQNVVTYPVIIKAPNRDMKLMPGMTANISFEIEARKDVLRIPAAALRFTPEKVQVRPDDQHYVEPLQSGNVEGARRSADEKAEQARSRQHRIVWVRDGELLRAVPVTLGLIDNRHAEVLAGELTEGQEVVTGIETGAAKQ